MPRLLERLDAPAEVIWDQRNDPWDTGVRALLETDRDADYRMILEDDVLVCRDLVAGCRRALTHVPEGHPVGLFVGADMSPPINETFDRARAAGRAWLVDWGPWWGQGFVVPTADVEGIAEFGPTCHTPAWDARVALYFKRQGRLSHYPVPSLIEHRPMAENQSVENPNYYLPRQAQWFIGEGASALDVDWNTGLERGPCVI